MAFTVRCKIDGVPTTLGVRGLKTMEEAVNHVKHLPQHTSLDGVTHTLTDVEPGEVITNPGQPLGVMAAEGASR